MRLTGKNHTVTLFFAVTLFAVFALTSLLVAVLGARVYHGTAEDMTQNYNSRTSLSYIAEKVRQADETAAVTVEAFGDGDALVLSQTAGDAVYQTYIYRQDGSLCELLMRADAGLGPESGQEIMAVSDFVVSWAEEGLLRLRLTDAEGHAAELLLSPRCG